MRQLAQANNKENTKAWQLPHYLLKPGLFDAEFEQDVDN